MKPKLPEVTFSKWYRWSDRNSIEGSKNPGVYLLAKFERSPPSSGPANPLQDEIVYIGETCASLRRRWCQFNNSAFRNGKGHSGGYTYRRKMQDKGENLFVAAFPVSADVTPQALQFSFIRFLERKLILDFVIYHENKLPSCNTE